ncbi:MAG TPA: SRPBCC family protein [Woeseiaceae bacterium]|nr:SRPBCC family protein [Woeseiaceae bacterium]
MSRFQVRPSMTLPAVALALLRCSGATAEVIDAEASGFTTRHSVTVSRPRAEVYKAATAGIGSWWSDDHTVSGRAANMYLEPRVQGCFCERLGEQGGVVHMLVTFVNPAVMLRLSGGLGPLGLMGVSGNMTWEFTDSADGTTMTWSYAVGGYFPGGLDQISSAVDLVLTEQMNQFKKFAEESRATP